MTIFQALILGVIQGITEFLPVSSSAHLVLTPFLLGWDIPEAQIFPFDVLVQVGTLLAVLFYFRRDIWEILSAVLNGVQRRAPFADVQSRLGWLILLGTVPAGIAGVLIKEIVEKAFNSPRATALFLFGTALLLILAEFIGKRTRSLDNLNWKDALLIGVFQALALFPGISRSGATIACGMLRNLERKSAARFSFLLMIPAMLAAGLVSLLDLLEVPDLASFLPAMITGFVTSALVGYFAIAWLLSFLRRRPLYVFAAYCAALAALTLILSYV